MCRNLFIFVLLFTLTSAQLSSNNIDDEMLNIDEKKIDLTNKYLNDTLNNSTNTSTPVPINEEEILNQEHVNLFSKWLESKSDELQEMNLKFSGFKLLNEIYNVELKKDAQFAYINFTDMIVNISKSIGEVLHNKTRVVKDLSDLVERTYEDFRNNEEDIRESTEALYLDSKSPKTFCDINEMYMSKKDAKKGGKVATKPADKSSGTPGQTQKKKRQSEFIEPNEIVEEDDIEENESEIIDDVLKL